ncbi:hypothetical protein DPEC_G00066060 [Dallia pectoralis]|uniref:Uncharacterized protein n=1 Tax=Dallia pectoralis TaxID=75939 RepID=A0ACC2H8W2_DALPE|nr:hypothetical protein DPEC_G00066060 [Dallia pectoralis]
MWCGGSKDLGARDQLVGQEAVWGRLERTRTSGRRGHRGPWCCLVWVAAGVEWRAAERTRAQWRGHLGTLDLLVPD